jgi:hypothetical protein
MYLVPKEQERVVSVLNLRSAAYRHNICGGSSDDYANRKQYQ